MINREMKEVTVRTYTSGKDQYGQTRQLGQTDRTTQMAIYLFSHNNVEDPRYNAVEYVGLTKDTGITTENEILKDGVVYQVLYPLQTKRYWSILMRKKA